MSQLFLKGKIGPLALPPVRVVTWIGLFNRQADFALLVNVNNFYPDFILLLKVIPNVTHKSIGYFGDVHQPRYPARELDKGPKPGNAGHFTLKDTTYCEGHKDSKIPPARKS